MLAILYDIHGNLPALEAVLEDAGRAGAERFLLGGDYALFGAFPAETVDALRRISGAEWIRGNVDRWCAAPDTVPDDELVRGAVEDCRAALGEQRVAELGQLPQERVVDGIRYCHASPLTDLESFAPAPHEDDERLLAGASEGRIVFGHTHVQFRRSGPAGVELINPGSVGAPLDGDRRAAYALLDDTGDFEMRRVEYDIEPSLVALARFGQTDWAARSVRILRSGRV